MGYGWQEQRYVRNVQEKKPKLVAVRTGFLMLSALEQVERRSFAGYAATPQNDALKRSPN